VSSTQMKHAGDLPRCEDVRQQCTFEPDPGVEAEDLSTELLGQLVFRKIAAPARWRS